MPNMSLDERRKALYPELFMSAAEQEQASARLAENMSAEMAVPANAFQATMANSLGGSANALWQCVISNFIKFLFYVLYKSFCKLLAIRNAKSVFCHLFAKNAFCKPSAIMCHPLIKTLF